MNHPTMSDCLFCKIIAKEIPSTSVYEDADTYAFLDIKPVHPGHVLVVPKIHSRGLQDAQEEVLQHLMLTIRKVARAVTIALKIEGFNIEQNNGSVAGQVVPHLHFHIIPRYPNDGLKHWPGKDFQPEEAEKIAGEIRTAVSVFN